MPTQTGPDTLNLRKQTRGKGVCRFISLRWISDMKEIWAAGTNRLRERQGRWTLGSQGELMAQRGALRQLMFTAVIPDCLKVRGRRIQPTEGASDAAAATVSYWNSLMAAEIYSQLHSKRWPLTESFSPPWRRHDMSVCWSTCLLLLHPNLMCSDNQLCFCTYGSSLWTIRNKDIFLFKGLHVLYCRVVCNYLLMLFSWQVSLVNTIYNGGLNRSSVLRKSIQNKEKLSPSSLCCIIQTFNSLITALTHSPHWLRCGCTHIFALMKDLLATVWWAR